MSPRAVAALKAARLSALATALTGVLMVRTCPAAEAEPSASASGGASAGLHSSYGELLQRYVTDRGVRYAAWAASRADRATLHAYLERVQAVDPAQLSAADAQAFWINAYNAATLELVLEHFPLRSLKELGDGDRSAWKRPVLALRGRHLSLDAIENDVIRPRFKDPRAHFALNCAALGCPPLLAQPYEGARLDAQLNLACRRALADARWVQILPDRILITRLFEWYRGDFERNGGSVRAFIAHYRASDSPQLLDTARPVEYLGYDWALNVAQTSP